MTLEFDLVSKLWGFGVLGFWGFLFLFCLRGLDLYFLGIFYNIVLEKKIKGIPL